MFDPAKVEGDLRAMTRIVLRPIGSPLPLGFFTVAIDNVLVSALQWGLLPAADRRAVALIVFVAVASSSILFAVGYELVGGENAKHTLDGMKQWMTDHNHAVMAVLFLVFGVVLIAKGVGLLS